MAVKCMIKTYTSQSGLQNRTCQELISITDSWTCWPFQALSLCGTEKGRWLKGENIESAMVLFAPVIFPSLQENQIAWDKLLIEKWFLPPEILIWFPRYASKPPYRYRGLRAPFCTVIVGEDFRLENCWQRQWDGIASHLESLHASRTRHKSRPPK